MSVFLILCSTATAHDYLDKTLHERMLVHEPDKTSQSALLDGFYRAKNDTLKEIAYFSYCSNLSINRAGAILKERKCEKIPENGATSAQLRGVQTRVLAELGKLRDLHHLKLNGKNDRDLNALNSMIAEIKSEGLDRWLFERKESGQSMAGYRPMSAPMLKEFVESLKKGILPLPPPSDDSTKHDQTAELKGGTR